MDWVIDHDEYNKVSYKTLRDDMLSQPFLWERSKDTKYLIFLLVDGIRGLDGSVTTYSIEQVKTIGMSYELKVTDI